MLYSHIINIHLHAESYRRHNKDERHSSLEKYTSHFIWKGCVWEGVGDRTELQHDDPHSSGHNSVSSLFSCIAQPGAWVPTLLSAGFLYRILSPTRLIPNSSDLQLPDFPGYIIVRRPPSSCAHSFNPFMVKVIISWYSSTGCTCYLHRCISYFDNLAGSAVNMQHKCLLDLVWGRSRCTWLMRPNKVETAVQWFRMLHAVLAVFSGHDNVIYNMVPLFLKMYVFADLVWFLSLIVYQSSWVI